MTTANAGGTGTPPASNVDIVTYIHTDGLGSPVAKSDASGAVVSRMRYEPYGGNAGGVPPVIGFTGHVNDASTGLVYMQQRYYDPVAGRFLSIDPVATNEGNGHNFNRYYYANNSPYKYVDPDGRFGIVGAAIGASVELGIQLYKDGHESNLTAIGVAAGFGAVTGGLGGIVGKAAVAGTVSVRTGVVAGAAVGGAAGAVSKVVEAQITGEKIGSSDVAVAAAAGAAGGAAGTGIGLKAVASLNKMANAPGVAGHIGGTTQAAIQQGGKVVGPATTVGHAVGLTAVETASSHAEQTANLKKQEYK